MLNVQTIARPGPCSCPCFSRWHILLLLDHDATPSFRLQPTPIIPLISVPLYLLTMPISPRQTLYMYMLLKIAQKYNKSSPNNPKKMKLKERKSTSTDTKTKILENGIAHAGVPKQGPETELTGCNLLPSPPHAPRESERVARVLIGVPLIGLLVQLDQRPMAFTRFAFDSVLISALTNLVPP